MQKQYFKSATILKSLILEDRQKSIYWFNFANCLFMLKRYQDSIKYFDQVITLNRQFTVIAKINKAKALVALGRAAEAENILESVVHNPAPSPLSKLATVELATIREVFTIEDAALQKFQNGEVTTTEVILRTVREDLLSNDALILFSLSLLKQNKKKEAEQLLFRASRSRWFEPGQDENVAALLRRARSAESFEKPYWLYVDLAVGSTDNVFVDGTSQPLVASNISNLATSVGYYFLKNEKLSYSLGYALYYEEPQAASMLKYSNQTLIGTVSFEEKKFLLVVTPTLQLQTMNGINAIQRAGIAAKTSYQLPESEYGIEISVFDKAVLDPVYSYLKGAEFGLRPYYGIWSENYYAQLAALAGSDLSSDIEYADSSLLPLNQSFVGLNLKGAWLLSEKNILQSGLTVVQRNFKNRTQPNGKERFDQELAITFKYSHYILPQLFMYVTIDHTSNQSTLGPGDVRDKNYKTNILSIGINWDVFE